MKIMHAIEIGMEILSAIESLVSGGGASREIHWQGKKYTVSITPQS